MEAIKIRGASLGVKNLVKTYGQSNVVQDVNFDLEAGQFLTLLGPSGSGKSTTLLMIAGFTEPTSGMIYINDQPVTKLPPHKRDIGMVFQNYALFPHMTIFDNVAFPLNMRRVSTKEKKERVEEYLRLVNLEDLADRYPHQISGGQQQRVALARALVFNPSLVLMDEPLGALDRRLRLKMQYEIKKIQTELGLTVVYVTHDQEEALTMSDKIAVMERGSIAAIGTPKAIYENPNSRFVANFIGESNLIEGKIIENTSTGQVIMLRSGHKVIGTTTSMQQGEEVLLMIRPERLRICQSDDNAFNKLPGQISGEIYLGGHTLYLVNVADTLELTVQRPNRGFGEKLEVGQEIYVGWEITNCVTLRNDKEDLGG